MTSAYCSQSVKLPRHLHHRSSNHCFLPFQERVSYLQPQLTLHPIRAHSSPMLSELKGPLLLRQDDGLIRTVSRYAVASHISPLDHGAKLIGSSSPYLGVSKSVNRLVVFCHGGLEDDDHRLQLGKYRSTPTTQHIIKP